MTAESMIERVARAIHETMDLTDGLDIEAAKGYARAAIEAMREPTEPELQAAAKVRFGHLREVVFNEIREERAAQIDAAPKETV